jgi:hypothetical protein
MVAASDPTAGQTSFANLKAIIDANLTSIGGSASLTFFGMDVSATGTRQVMKDLACEYQGTHTKLGDVTY